MSDLVARLIAAGTPPDLIGEVAMLVARSEIDREAIEARRSKDRDRQANRRHVMSRDTADVTDTPPVLDKETSPRPPKEINPTPRTRTRATAGHRLPDDWRPTTLGRDTVAGQIVAARGQEWARRALESFKNHWRTANGPNSRKRDWQAAWANWVIEQDNRDGKRNGTANGMGGNRGQSASGHGVTVDAAQRFLARHNQQPAG